MDNQFCGCGPYSDILVDPLMAEPLDMGSCMAKGMENGAIAACVDSLPLTMAYMPMQRLNTVYEPEEGLNRGTIFPELDKPWKPEGSCRER